MIKKKTNRARNYLLLTTFLATALFSAEYIVPPDYDNLVASNGSSGKSLLTNSSSPGVTGVIGGRVVTYRCLTIPAIDCRGSTPQMVANVSEVSLKEPVNNELVNAYTTDIIVRNTGTNFLVCGAAIGGMVWDTSELNVTQDPVTGDTTLNYNYQPNTKGEIYYFFTSELNNGSSRSYMAIETKQVCH